MSIKVHILNSEDFDALPKSATRGSDISSSLGFANKFTGQAFVRYSAYPELTSFLVNHEIEELMARESSHEDENGIRHKKLGRTTAAFLFPPALASSSFRKGLSADTQAKQRNQERDAGQAGIRQQEGLRSAFEQGSRFSSPGVNAGIGGALGGPLGAFSTTAGGSPQVPGSSGGGLSTGLGGGSLSGGGINQQLQQRVKGFFSGRDPRF